MSNNYEALQSKGVFLFYFVANQIRKFGTKQHLKMKRKRTKSKRNFSWLQSRQTLLILTLADCKSPRRAFRVF